MSTDATDAISSSAGPVSSASARNGARRGSGSKQARTVTTASGDHADRADHAARPDDADPDSKRHPDGGAGGRGGREDQDADGPEPGRPRRRGRRETEINPTTTPLAAFACELRELRNNYRDDPPLYGYSDKPPTYRDMAGHAHCSASTLSEAARGVQVPRLATVLAYAAALGHGDPEQQKMWRRKYYRMTNDQHRNGADRDHPSAPPNTSRPPGETSHSPQSPFGESGAAGAFKRRGARRQPLSRRWANPGSFRVLAGMMLSI